MQATTNKPPLSLGTRVLRLVAALAGTILVLRMLLIFGHFGGMAAGWLEDGNALEQIARLIPLPVLANLALVLAMVAGAVVWKERRAQARERARRHTAGEDAADSVHMDYGMGRLASVFGLVFLAPWVGEFLLGNIPLDLLFALPFLAPMYGGGALLIRELVRRTGRGWPSILLLGAAYGIIEAGLADQSLFNPSFEGHDFHEVTPVPALGISAYNAFAFIVGHAVWSISVPIAIVELLSPSRRTVPWLGRTGLVVTAVVYVLGLALIFFDLYAKEDFLASPWQLAGAAGTALLLIGAAFALRPRSGSRGGGRVPRPRLLGGGTFLVAGVFMVRPENWLGGVLGGALLVGAAALVVWYWSRQRGWSVRHELALVAGLLLTYAWLGFALTGLLRPGSIIAWVGNLLFLVLAVGLLVLTDRVMRLKQGLPGIDPIRPTGLRSAADRRAHGPKGASVADG